MTDATRMYVVHLAAAISIRNLHEEVSARCPQGCSIPSEEWLRLQFWPKTAHMKSLHYTGRLKVKFMIQQRQWRKDHPDTHYAAAIYRYLREYEVQVWEHASFVSLDDKHRVKVGEPRFPVAAAERGRKVLVSVGSSFQVGDHDFTKFSIIPSVQLHVDIPTDISDSGAVHVGLKEGAFEPSTVTYVSCAVYWRRKSLNPFYFFSQMEVLTIASPISLSNLAW